MAGSSRSRRYKLKACPTCCKDVPSNVHPQHVRSCVDGVPMKPLTPPDTKRCQAEQHNGWNFMTCGGRSEMIRCAVKPVLIVTEKHPGADGRRGSMSLCGACYAVFDREKRVAVTIRAIP